MNKLVKNFNAFTLIEIMVSITIFSVMIISIIWIYIVSSDVMLKSDINRMMQENLKNVSNTIAEDIRKNGITGVSSNSIDPCDFNLGINKYKTGNKLCTNSGNLYYLAKLDNISGNFLRVNSSECSNLEDKCVIAKGLREPLTNSFVSIKSLDFYLSSDYVPKLTMNIVLYPSVQKGVKVDLIKSNKLIFQTTVSERPF